MNPWLENPLLWGDVHESLIIALRDYLAPILDYGQPPEPPLSADDAAWAAQLLAQSAPPVERSD